MAVPQDREAVAVGHLSEPLLSVVVPVLNEGDRLRAFVDALRSVLSASDEVIVVDGGSTDSSLDVLTHLQSEGKITHLLNAPKGRARQMNAGARAATGAVLLFLHADTRLPLSAKTDLHEFATSSAGWGRFNIKLASPGWPYKMIAWFINQRSRLTGIATGDQAIFVQRTLFEAMSGYADQPLMEDIDLSARLKKAASPLCLRSTVLCSARKWQQHGIIQTIWLMWRLRAAYALGVSPEALVRQYYKS